MLTFTVDSAEAFCDLQILDRSFDSADIAANLNEGTLILEFDLEGNGIIKTAETGIDVARFDAIKFLAGADLYDFSTSFTDRGNDDDGWDEDDWDDEEDAEDEEEG